MDKNIDMLMKGFVTPIDFQCGDDSKSIQAAIDLGSKYGVKVVIPGYNPRTGDNIWHITEALKLHTGSAVIIDNCVLRQTDGMVGNIFRNSNKGTELGYAKEGRQYDICIIGQGNAVLDGDRHNGLCEANSMKNGNPHVTENSPINFLNVERVKISGLRIVRQRYWGMTFHYSSDVRISDIDFEGTNINLNSDGIDLRTGCSNFIIENITGYTEDDTIALTCLRSIYDVMMPDFDNSIHDVIVRNVIASSPRGLVRVLNHYGKKVYNVVIENIIESTSCERLGSCVRIGENSYYKDNLKAEPDDTYNITVRNITSRARMGVRVSCVLSDSLFDNINVMGDGGTAVYFGEGIYDRITVSNINYSPDNTPALTDDNRIEKSWNKLVPQPIAPDRKVCAVYFKSVEHAGNIVFSGLNAGKKITSVFGGEGNVEGKVYGLVRQNDAVPLFDCGENVKIELL